MRICVAGQGAFGQKHLDALKRIPDVEITSLVGGNQDATAKVAEKYGIKHYTGELSEGIKRADAVILTTPTKMRFRQGEQVMRAGKHVLVEIPITDSVKDAENLLKIAKETGVTAMGGHVRRFNPSHQWIHKRIEKSELKIQQMDVQTYFFRRKNLNGAHLEAASDQCDEAGFVACWIKKIAQNDRHTGLPGAERSAAE